MSNEAKHRRVMEKIWDDMHRGPVDMPSDRLILEGDHDLIYLYQCGFVDTDRFSLDGWMKAFADSKQSNGQYHLTKEQWLSKVKYRFNEVVRSPFDPLLLREGVWSVEQLKQFAKDVIIPETTITYEQYLKGLREAERNGDIRDGKITIDQAWKQKLKDMMDTYASPQRRRALAVQKARQHEEMEEGAPIGSAAPTPRPAAPAAKTSYQATPDQRKALSNKLADLLSGGKK